MASGRGIQPPGRRRSNKAGAAGQAAAAAALLAALCCLGRGQAEEQVAHPNEANVVRLTMRTPHRGFNRMLVSLTICEPGRTNCATIDDVMIDTGATGLRLEASAVPAWLQLPPVLGPDHKPLAECLHFLHDTAWGPLRRADLSIGGLKAADLSIQVIDDRSLRRPEACRQSGDRPTSNGTLGIGPYLTDCRGACEQSLGQPTTFSCVAEGCVPVRGPLAPEFRLHNPVSLFPGHDNGIVVDLPAVPDAGADEIVGTLTFGVGTAENNRPGSAAIVPLDQHGRFSTWYDGRAFPLSYIDSGTPTYIFADRDLHRCDTMAWAFCLAPERRLNATIGGPGAETVSVPFKVGNYASFLERGFGVADDVAVAGEPGSKAFVWGAPFFPGKRVYVLIEGRTVPGMPDTRGPLYAIGERRSP